MSTNKPSADSIVLPNQNIFLNANQLNITNDEDEKSVRISNPLTLRLTARNSIVNYNALQKVFRARFEDGRANVTLQQFSQLSQS